MPTELIFGLSTRPSVFWDALIIEKRISVNWLYALYKKSIFQAFWLVLSSPVK